MSPRVLASAVALTLILAACGGEAAPSSPSASSPAPASAAASSAAAKPSAASSASVSAAASPASASGSASAGASGSAAAKPSASGSTAGSAAASSLASAAASAPAGKVLNVGISQLFPHPVLDAYRKAMIDEMAAEGFSDGKNIKIDYQNSQGDVNAAKTIADKFVAANDDLIICITTPSCIAASKATQSIPVVFGYVTDPVAAGIVKDATRAGGNVTGVTSLDSVNDQFKWMHDIDPKATKIGTVWNPGEANSKVLVDSMKKVAPTYGYTIVEATASNSNEVPPAAQSLVGKADAIFITGDNTAQAALPAIVKVGEANKLPVFTSDVHSVDQGAIATYNFFEEDLGKQTGAMAVKILKGAKPGDTPVEKPLQFKLVVNPGAAERMGITIPPDIVSKADRVVKS